MATQKPDIVDGGATGRAGGGARRSRAGAQSQTGTGRSQRGLDLQADLREFAAGRPDGWSHDDWLSFLDYLRSRGHDVSDGDAIGMQLERERLAVKLQQVQGVGPQRVKALTERFGTIWSLREASEEQIAEAAKVPRSLAERIKSSI